MIDEKSELVVISHLEIKYNFTNLWNNLDKKKAKISDA